MIHFLGFVIHGLAIYVKEILNYAFGFLIMLLDSYFCFIVLFLFSISTAIQGLRRGLTKILNMLMNLCRTNILHYFNAL